MSPSLSDPATRAQLIARLRTLTPQTERRWGTMNASQMLWHLTQAFRVALGDLQERDRSNWFFRQVVRRIAFYTPMPWPKNGPTLPTFDAVKRVPVVETPFAQQVEMVEALVQRFADPASTYQPHPMFGPLSRAEWLHWGWRHTDHHLRQFGQ